MSKAALVDEISVKQYFRPVSNQSFLSSCVANATADAFEAVIARRKGVSPDAVKDLSRLFIYYNARNISNPPMYEDKGSHIRFAFDSISRYGCCEESVYPYNTDLVNKQPTQLAYREAIKNRIYSYYRIDATGDERVEQIIKALVSKCPVVFGAEISNSLLTFNKGDEVIDVPSGDIAGRHAMVCVGYSASKNAFEIRNSWGSEWNGNGYCWFSVDYLKDDTTKDLWVPSV
jgi:C1A family cysteine protease